MVAGRRLMLALRSLTIARRRLFLALFACALLLLHYASRPNSDLDGRLRGDTSGYTSERFALDHKANVELAETLRVSAGINNVTSDRAWVYHPYPQRTFFLEAGVKL